jgi:membrane-associated phospholipid phosphatase
MHAERHYLSDVIMGATIGMLAGRSVPIGKNEMRFSISPVAVRGGAGVTVIRIQQ